MPKPDRVRSVAERHCAEGRFASIEWRATRAGRKWLSGRAGMADPLNGIKLPAEPIYRIYSMTKPVVSAIALMLLEEGRLRLYDPVAEFVPAFAAPEILSPDGKRARARRPMLVEHLLTHRAGLTYGFLADCPVAALYRQTDLGRTARSLEDFVATVAALPLAFEPGTEWRYSVATDILARVIEAVEGKPITDVVKERVTGPLGLADTGFFVRRKQRHRILPMFGNGNLDAMMNYPPGPQTLVPAEVSAVYPADNPEFGRGGYGLFSTTRDYLEIARFLASGKSGGGGTLLSRKAVELMWINRIPPSQLPLTIGPIRLPGYGFSLAGRVMIDPGVAFGLTSFGEIGWSGAASTYFFVDPRERVIGVVMSQYVGSKVPLADDMRNAMLSMLE
jgi:CubicO group peptidase (beta-lactamase class C family)